MAKRRALVIGGSLGGLLAAQLLRDTGWDAVVLERNAEDLTGRGAGVSTHPQLVDILARVGIAFDDSMGIAVDTVICLDRAGRVYLQEKTARTMSSWGRLYRSLRDPLPPQSYRLGMSLERIEQDADGVTAVLADGRRERGDLLVGADGLRSTVREQFLPEVQPSYAGYVAWRATLEEREVPAIHAEIFERYTFCLPEGELLLAYPVPGRNNETQPGRRAYNIVWYRPTDPDRALVDLCTDASGRCHGTSIPPPLIRPDVTAAIKATARALVAPQVAEIFACARQPFFQPIFDLESPRTVFGRVALVGDAAFVARPHVGAGVTKAALDAAGLADAVSGGDLAAGLTRYQREQVPFGSGLVRLGREEGAYLTAQLKPREERGAAELHRDIRDVLDAHNARSENLRKVLAGARRAT